MTGVRAIESRADFWTLEIPPLEHWRAEIQRLERRQQQGIQESGFYEFLRDQIGRRLRESACVADGSQDSSGAAKTATGLREPTALMRSLSRSSGGRRAVSA